MCCISQFQLLILLHMPFHLYAQFLHFTLILDAIWAQRFSFLPLFHSLPLSVSCHCRSFTFLLCVFFSVISLFTTLFRIHTVFHAIPYLIRLFWNALILLPSLVVLNIFFSFSSCVFTSVFITMMCRAIIKVVVPDYMHTQIHTLHGTKKNGRFSLRSFFIRVFHRIQSTHVSFHFIIFIISNK